jgi:hypothetical protein
MISKIYTIVLAEIIIIIIINSKVKTESWVIVMQ